jgi:hypothetical protein
MVTAAEPALLGQNRPRRQQIWRTWVKRCAWSEYKENEWHLFSVYSVYSVVKYLISGPIEKTIKTLIEKNAALLSQRRFGFNIGFKALDPV